MKNKKVKQMICDVLDIKDGFKWPFGHYFDKQEGLCFCFINGSPPDDFYEEAESVRHYKPVSLTGDQLRGLK